MAAFLWDMAKEEQRLPQALKQFKGTPEQYIMLAQEMDKNGKYSGTELRNWFGNILDTDLDPSSPWYKPPNKNNESGYFLLPKKIKNKKTGKVKWVLNRAKDKAVLATKVRLAAEEIPAQVKSDIIEKFGQEEFDKFSVWVATGVKKEKDLAQLLTAEGGERYDMGHWRAIQGNDKGVPASDWDWKGRAAHVGLNLSSEPASINRSRGNAADPSREFLLNIGAPTNWEEAWIHYKDPSGLASTKELGLSNKELQRIGNETSYGKGGSKTNYQPGSRLRGNIGPALGGDALMNQLHKNLKISDNNTGWPELTPDQQRQAGAHLSESEDWKGGSKHKENGHNGNGKNGNGKNGKGHGLSIDAKAGGLRTADQLLNLGTSLATGDAVGATISGGTLAIGQTLKNPAVQKKVASQVAELVAKRGAKTAAKLIPGLDIYLSGRETMGYLGQGRLGQAGIAALSGAVGWIPGVGDAASAALDITNTGIDIARLQPQSRGGDNNKKNRFNRRTTASLASLNSINLK